MKKRVRAAVLNTIAAAGGNVLNDASSGLWSIIGGSGELLLGSFPGSPTVQSFDPVAENQQVVTLGASATKETIIADTRYKIEIGNPDDKYESGKRWPVVHAYTSAAVLSGDADTDRLNVYTALVNKINGYGGNNCTAYLLHEFDYTLGGDSAGGTTITAGVKITQANSGATAYVAKASLSSGTWAGNDAAGTIWVYNVSGTIDDAVARAWTVGTFTLTQTISTLVAGTGIACVDDAGYFTSSIGRSGANWYGATQGFVTSQFEVIEAPVYPMGIGSVLAALVPRYNHSKQDAIEGNLDLELQNGAAFDTSKTYRKYVFTILDGSEEAMGGDLEKAESQVVLYADYASGNLADLNTAIGNL